MNTNHTDTNSAAQPVVKTDSEWRDELTPEQYEVLRQKGTEPPFTGAYVYEKEDGIYRCAACGAELFGSDAKFDSGTGWPSFTEPANRATSSSHATSATGCSAPRSNAGCGGHLGHVFPDGPARPASATASTPSP